jgi:prepilin signal peptidase PulO-like enzyme (type II secretory pathway)
LIISIIFYTVLGWLVAIAINHAADVLPLRQTLWQWPRCPACATPRPWLAWSALAAVLGGRQTCAGCGLRRTTLLRAALVEIIMPACFIFLLFRYDSSLKLPLMVLYSAILLLITVTDLEHRLIFNLVMLPAIVLALAAAFFTPGLAWPIALVGGAVGFVLSYVAALVSRGGLGSGDVTLSAFLGLILGLPHILLSLFFGVFLGGVVALLLLLSRRVGLKSYIPYGPFLTSTGWIMLVWGDAIWRYYFAR